MEDTAETEIVSAHGALLRMKTPPDAKEIEIVRPRQHQSTTARIVATYPVGADGLVRVAVELTVPSESFWGITLPPTTS